MAKEGEIIDDGQSAYSYYYHRSKGSGGMMLALLLIFIGLVFLLKNLGFLPPTVWGEVWKFWPVLVILLGVRILAGRNTVSRVIISIITLLVFIGIFVFILYYYGVLRLLGLPSF